jgi:hypothetical protein
VLCVMLCDACYCIVLYCTVLYRPILHCSTLPPGINPFSVTTITTTTTNNNDNFGTIKSALELLRHFILR